MDGTKIPYTDRLAWAGIAILIGLPGNCRAERSYGR